MLRFRGGLVGSKLVGNMEFALCSFFFLEEMVRRMGYQMLPTINQACFKRFEKNFLEKCNGYVFDFLEPPHG
jgi:hypothetical protein